MIAIPTKKIDDKRMKRTILEGAGGGLVGSFVGMPGLGVAAGVIYANKDKIPELKKKIRKFGI